MSFTSSQLPRSVKVIAAARGLSLLGDEVALIAWMFRAKAEFGHWGIVAVLAAGSAPLVLLAPYAGLLVDRARSRPLLGSLTGIQCAVTLALAWSGASTFVPLIAVLACATCVAGPAWQALVPTLVSDRDLPRAMSVVQTVFAASGMFGPFVGGLLFAWVGFRGVLFVDAASFLALLAVPLLLKAERRPQPALTRGEQDSAWSGLQFVWSSAALRSIIILLTLLILTLGVVNVVEIFFTTTVLHAGPRGYGLLGLCFGGGMVVAAATAPRLSLRYPRTERTFIVSCVMLVLFLALFSLSRTLAEAAVVLFLLGAANSILNVNSSVLLVRITTDVEHLRGRVMAAVTGLAMAAQILALLLGGVLLAFWGPSTIILLGAAASVATLAATIRPVLRQGAASPVIAIEPSDRRS